MTRCFGEGGTTKRGRADLLVVRVMGKQLLSWVQSEPLITKCILLAPKKPDASPRVKAVDLLDDKKGKIQKVSSFQYHYFKLAPMAITGRALKNINMIV